MPLLRVVPFCTALKNKKTVFFCNPDWMMDVSRVSPHLLSQGKSPFKMKIFLQSEQPISLSKLTLEQIKTLKILVVLVTPIVLKLEKSQAICIFQKSSAIAANYILWQVSFAVIYSRHWG